jgi:phage tail sheath protein FI
MAYNTPGVYIKEVSVFPPSVAEVETAIPAFIGYTDKAEERGEDLTNTPKRIKSLVEFELYFGGPPRPNTLNVTLDANNAPTRVEVVHDFLLYYSMQLFFANGGGDCYIVSVGQYGISGSANAVDNTELQDGIDAVAKYDEPTLLLFPDAILLNDAGQIGGLQQRVLTQCADLQDRFGVFDMLESNAGVDSDSGTFRTAIGINNLKYGAVYTPYLKTRIPLYYRYDDIDLLKNGAAATLTDLSTTAGISTTEITAMDTAVTNLDQAISNGDPAETINDLTEAMESAAQDLKNTNSIYAGVVSAIQAAGMTLPPSGAVVGVYSSVDNDRGVWKAPANVSLNEVNGPTVLIDDADQGRLNIDVNAGKSINAIRAFAGKGILVWGARTLAGNDNEWRYVSVRRFFNMVEESVKKSTGWAVFEPNAAPLWTKVKSMIENYLIQKWREGALAGAKPDEAFFVKVGLGQTMTAQDILEGRLIVEIGMAVVRPAEFIILKFSHKMQES